MSWYHESTLRGDFFHMSLRTYCATAGHHQCCVPSLVLQHVDHLWCPISLSEVNLPRTTFGGWLERKKVTRKASSSSSNDISIKSEYLSEVCTNRSQECNLFLICWHSVFTMVASLARKTRNVVNSSRAISQHLLQMKIIQWTSHTENGCVVWKRKPVLIYSKLVRMLD